MGDVRHKSASYETIKPLFRRSNLTREKRTAHSQGKEQKRTHDREWTGLEKKKEVGCE